MFSVLDQNPNLTPYNLFHRANERKNCMLSQAVTSESAHLRRRYSTQLRMENGPIISSWKQVVGWRRRRTLDTARRGNFPQLQCPQETDDCGLEQHASRLFVPLSLVVGCGRNRRLGIKQLQSDIYSLI